MDNITGEACKESVVLSFYTDCKKRDPELPDWDDLSDELKKEIGQEANAFLELEKNKDFITNA